MSRYGIELPEFQRGTEFKYHFVLGSGWSASMFTGGIWFTLRTSLPESDVLNDDDAIDQGGGVVARVSLDDGISFSTAVDGTVLIPAAATHTWPAWKLYWGIKGKVTVGNRVLALAWGTVPVIHDVPRTQ